MEYRECGNPCIDTCSNRQGSQLCDEHCMDGCFCVAGKSFDFRSRNQTLLLLNLNFLSNAYYEI